MSEKQPRADQEGFGEATLGEAQSENPPADPEMIRDEEDLDEGADEDHDAPED